mmetsp:Transcript_10421/g.13024  ORF Transcript_10421/g.13024 Transcript_10421/m.13024 type:complete len:103 (-) Transcript_10421:1777-2085(-)
MFYLFAFVAAIFCVYYTCSCLRNGGIDSNSIGGFGSSSVNNHMKKKIGSSTNTTGSNQFVIKEQRMSLLLEKSKKRYLDLHPEYKITQHQNQTNAYTKPHVE